MPLCKQFDDLKGEILEQMQMTNQFPTTLPNQPTNQNLKMIKYLDYVETCDDTSIDRSSHSPDYFESFKVLVENFLIVGIL